MVGTPACQLVRSPGDRLSHRKWHGVGGRLVGYDAVSRWVQDGVKLSAPQGLWHNGWVCGDTNCPVSG